MSQVTLGKTGITVNKNGFGALPIQRISRDEAVRLLRRALDGGITFFDTARGYTDSEEKLGEAFHGRDRGSFFLSSKTPAKNAADFWRDLDASLTRLRTDYIDIYQFHNPAFCPRPGGEDGLYEAMTEARRAWAQQHARGRSLRERAGAARDGADSLGRGGARQASRDVPN